jgi:5-(carboxyamino)imidazole ribonucleotide mutase
MTRIAPPLAEPVAQAAAEPFGPTDALVGVIMGSSSDWPTMSHACRILAELGVPFESFVVSAHRTPDRLVAYAKSAAGRGLQVVIAGAGGAAHLPGMTAAMTVLPVLGVPVQSKALSGQDSLLSIVQMPRGVPVATLAIGEAGAVNAGLLAAQILGLQQPHLQKRLQDRRDAERQQVEAEVLPVAQVIDAAALSVVTSGSRA